MKKIDWNKRVVGLGYGSLRDMLEDMYVNKKMPPHLIAMKLEVSIGVIWIQLKKLNIKRGRAMVSKDWGSKGGF